MITKNLDIYRSVVKIKEFFFLKDGHEMDLCCTNFDENGVVR